MTDQFMLGDWWLTEYMKRLEKYGASLDEITEYANSWERAAIRYGLWLYAEGFDDDEAIPMILQAVDQADFNLSRFPICP
jgi:hypothetical protein